MHHFQLHNKVYTGDDPLHNVGDDPLPNDRTEHTAGQDRTVLHDTESSSELEYIA